MAAPWDVNLANAAAMADHCMKIGAVILKPKGNPKPGFTQPPKVNDGG